MRGSGREMDHSNERRDSTEVEICQNKQDGKTNGGIWMKGAGITHTDLSPRLSQEAGREAVKGKGFQRLIVGT